jgi:hypothetical protein
MMPFAAKEGMLASPRTEEIFSLAAGVAAALETRDGTSAGFGAALRALWFVCG